jgi:hypothetical protein
MFFEFGGTGFQPVPHRRDACATIIFSLFPFSPRLKTWATIPLCGLAGADQSRDFIRQTDDLQKEKAENPCIGVRQFLISGYPSICPGTQTKAPRKEDGL